MHAKSWLVGATIGIGLLGCADRGLVARVGCTPSGNCRVEVTVVNCVVTVDPYRLPVPDRGRTKKIDWDIVSADYVFRGSGIVIANPSGVFDQPRLSPNGKSFTWRDLHPVAGDYKYSVNVIRTGDNPADCPTYDPVIANQ